MHRIVYIFILSLTLCIESYLSAASVSCDDALLEKGCIECHRGKRGHHGERGERGKRGITGTSGSNGAAGPTGCPGLQGLSGGVRCDSCPTTPITFTFTTLQDAALTGGSWQIILMQPDFSIVTGPVIDVTQPSQTFSITSTTPALVGTYAIYFKNVGTQNFTQPVLGGTNPLVVTNPCFSISTTFVFQEIANNYPVTTGTSTVWYFEAPICGLI